MKLEAEWNQVIKSLLETKRAWEILRGQSRDVVAGNASRYMALPFRRSPFEKALPLLLSYAWSQGGLEKLIVKETVEAREPDVVKPKAKEEKQDGEGS